LERQGREDLPPPVSALRHIPSMRTLTRFVAAVVTAAVVPACSVIASSVAHADPVATSATVLKVVDGDTVDIVDDVRGRLRIRLLGTYYRDYRDCYRAMTTELGYEGHVKWAEAMP
jgi:endonuclease YncB( thermonuclease family)